MLQTPPLPAAQGLERPTVGPPDAGETAPPGAFARALRQAKQEDTQVPEDEVNDDPESRSPLAAQHQASAMQPGQSRARKADSAASSVAPETAAGTAAIAAPSDANGGVASSRDAVRDIAARPDADPKSEQQAAAAQLAALIAASDTPAVPAVRPNAPKESAPVVDEPALAFATDTPSDRSPAPARKVHLTGGERARARPADGPAVADAGAAPFAVASMSQRASDARTTAALPDPLHTTGMAQDRSMVAEAASFGAVAPVPTFNLAAGATGSAAQASGTAPTMPAHATLTSSVESPDFAPAFGAQVALWVSDGVQEARLHLHPAELGPVSVQIALDGTTARVDFHALHAQTRAAIEESLPALAVALRESGMTLSGGGVFGQSAGDRGTHSPGAPAERSSGDTPIAPAGVVAIDRPVPRAWRSGLLDVFA